MRLTAEVKLLTTPEQADALLRTLAECNAATDWISERAHETGVRGRYALHRLTYHDCRAHFAISAQTTCLAIGRVAAAYRRDESKRHAFAPGGAVSFDSRLLRVRAVDVSIWTVDGRQTIPLVCGQRQRALLASQAGESDLVLRGGKWYLQVGCAVAEPESYTPDGFLGVDLGIVNIAKGIRSRIRARRPQRATLHSWAFAQLAEYVGYKAALAGVPVAYVDPRNTSRTCPTCGHIAKANRPTQAKFRCVECSSLGDADHFAAIEIGRRAAVDRPDSTECVSLVSTDSHDVESRSL